MLSSKAVEIAKSLKIQPEYFKWYAAFHNESHHPHVHIICYSTRPTEGYLTKEGINKMKSALANEIFKQELIPLYAEKTQQREELKEESAKVLYEYIQQMKNGTLQNKKMEQLVIHLANRLQHISGKKQYGYLKAGIKNVVDEIVEELARDERIAAAYHVWQETKGRVEHVYSEQSYNQLPLSRCEDFKSIKNKVIEEALLLRSGEITFEDTDETDQVLSKPMEEDRKINYLEPMEFISDEEPMIELVTHTRSDSRRNTNPSWWTNEYKLAKQYLYGDEEVNIHQDFDRAQKLFIAEAGRNNPLAMCDLGRMSADGLGCEANEENANDWYAKGLAEFYSAEKSKTWKYTEYRIGKMHASGLGTEQDYQKAVKWLTLSAEEGYRYAQYSLGGLYYNGKGVEQNYETAYNLYLRSADQNFPYASFEVGRMLKDGIGCEKCSQKSEQYFADAFCGFEKLEMKSHDDNLQYRLGWMLLNGVGTQKNLPSAKMYFEKAATVGNSFACYQFAKLILSDEGASTKEVEKALSYLNKSVETGNSYAQYFLAKLCEKGQHVPQNYAEAVRLYTLSAEQDNDYAAYRLGRLYLDGDAVPKNIMLAFHCLEISAEKKNQYAQYLLGKLYLTGKEVQKDVEAALRYLHASAAQENQYAQYTLGKLYLIGRDVTRDKEIAATWLSRSAAQGNIYAQFLLDHMRDFKEPSAFLSATHLLHHMSRIFNENVPPIRPQEHRTDRKLMQKIRAKKLAQGHVSDDHEQTMLY